MKNGAAQVFVLCSILPATSFAKEHKTGNNNDELHFRPWTTFELVLGGGLVAGNVIDAIQTSRIPDIRGAEEANPLFRNDDGTPNMKQVVLFKSIAVGAILIASAYAPHTYRKILLSTANCIQWSVVGWNEYVSGGVIVNW